MSHDDNMRPNCVGWESDTPFALSQALHANDLTRFKHGTSLAFYTVTDMHPIAFAVSYCSHPKRHAHVSISRDSALAHVSIVTTVAYALALALDRADWATDVPSKSQIEDAWEDVLEVVEDEHPPFASFLRAQTQPGGSLSTPMEWTLYYKPEARTRDPHAN